MTLGLVNRILPFSSVDGPGNRTAIFLQGCNFNCLYCHNPETINICSSCGACIGVCPVGALSKADNNVVWDVNKCASCDACIRKCEQYSSPRAAYMSVGDCLSRIKRVKPFISGITVSGGECTLQKDFLIELFNEVHKLGLTAFADTNGSLDFSKEKELAEAMDMAMLDIKSFDNDEHRMLTGMPNDVVLKNAAYLAGINKLYEVRTVIVPGILDNRRNVDGISRLIAGLNPNIGYKIIKFRPVGVRANMKHVPVPDNVLMNELEDVAKKNGCRNVIVV